MKTEAVEGYDTHGFNNGPEKRSESTIEEHAMTDPLN